MATYYPPVGFHFSVEFTGLSTSEKDHQFQSVSGLTVDIETEEITEGGENRFKHKIPVRTKYPNLVLKRGLLVDSKVVDWCKKAVENFDFEPINMIVKLLNEKHEPLLSWNIVHAYPIKWSIADFNAEESKVVIETIELVYNYYNTIT
ncbi:phage tail protein [Aquimarina sp. 2201CG5-10]|uniref:phage tail protein n=1 Tax=Aquimarina callyspongiae TaxID=3098150 RepID=UPI002AB3463C|nr:phage tail protein [Aquimarina sp. 2201CG5-10]MDY8138097.1 phage tail protein [Aquimarina sp. 2201CG5-10]